MEVRGKSIVGKRKERSRRQGRREEESTEGEKWRTVK